MEDTRCDWYRDILEIWVTWWNGPGRRDFRGSVLPPLTKTGEALSCIGCAGLNTLPDGERCRACGRLGRVGALGYFPNRIEDSLRLRAEREKLLRVARAAYAARHHVFEAGGASGRWGEFDELREALFDLPPELFAEVE